MVTCTETEEWVCTFYAGRDGRSCDWGVNGRERAMRWMQAADNGATFFGDDGAYCDMTGAEFVAHAMTRTFTYGVFGGTFQVGTGDAMTYQGF